LLIEREAERSLGLPPPFRVVIDQQEVVSVIKFRVAWWSGGRVIRKALPDWKGPSRARPFGDGSVRESERRESEWLRFRRTTAR
jgi:hypothetical protein